MAAYDSSDIQVIISYKKLHELLEASKRVESLEKQYKRLAEQQAALRSLYTELLIEFGDLKKFLND